MRRIMAVLGLAFVSACASTETGVAPAQRQVTSVGGAGVEVERFTDGGSAVQPLAFGRAAVWPALLAGYAELQIPLTMMRENEYTVGNPRLVRTRTLAGRRLSTFFNCGMTVSSGQAADSHLVEISIVSTVSEVDARESRLETRARATATAQGVSSSPVECSSTGRLEALLANSVMLHLAKQTGE